MRYLGERALSPVMVLIAALALAVTARTESVAPIPADAESIKLATDIFKQLVEINTTHSVGSATVAAEAMAKRLRDTGFPNEDVLVMGPDSRKGNIIAARNRRPQARAIDRTPRRRGG
jgi:hypothetical protein